MNKRSRHVRSFHPTCCRNKEAGHDETEDIDVSSEPQADICRMTLQPENSPFFLCAVQNTASCSTAIFATMPLEQ